MKPIVIFPLIVGLLSATAAFAQTQPQQQRPPIYVTAKPLTIDKWVRTMSHRLNANLDYPTLPFREPNEGIARVTFRCGDSGTPTAISLVNSSGHRELDRAAVKAVKRLGSLHPLANGIARDQRVQAVLVFALDERSRDHQLAALRRDSKLREAWFGKDAKQIALGISLVPQS